MFPNPSIPPPTIFYIISTLLVTISWVIYKKHKQRKEPIRYFGVVLAFVLTLSLALLGMIITFYNVLIANKLLSIIT